MRTDLAFHAALVLTALLLAFSCADDSSDDDSAADDDGNEGDDTGGTDCDDDTEWQKECGDNSPPVLLGLSYEVNGEVLPGPVSVTNEDEVALLIEYEDIDCNLAGGGWATGNSGPDGGVVPHAFDGQIGCSSEAQGSPYRAVVTVLDFGAGNGPFSVYFTDFCGADSNVLSVWLEWQP